MKIPRVPHSWRLPPSRARALQQQLRGRVSQSPPRRELRWVAGLDAAYSRDDRACVAAAVVWDLQNKKVLEQQTARRRLAFPYIPGLLSFREAPAILAALRKLKCRPDVLMCDGHGLAHPRRFGIACHLGVLCGLPAIGCAKSLFIGAHGPLSAERGARVAILDQGQVIGTVLRTQSGIKPVYVSIGHKMDLATAEKIVLDCASTYRLPEPVRLADRVVAALKAR